MKRLILENTDILCKLERLTKKLGEALAFNQFCKLNEITLNKEATTDFQGLLNSLQKLSVSIKEWGEKDIAGRDEYENLKGDQHITLNIFNRYEAQAIFLFRYLDEFIKNHKQDDESFKEHLVQLGSARNALMKSLQYAVNFWTQRNNQRWNGHIQQNVDQKEKIYLKHFWDGSIAKTNDYDPKIFEAWARDPNIINAAANITKVAA